MIFKKRAHLDSIRGEASSLGFPLPIGLIIICCCLDAVFNQALLPLTAAINLPPEVSTLWQIGTLSMTGIAANVVYARICPLRIPFSSLFLKHYSFTETDHCAPALFNRLHGSNDCWRFD